MPFYHHRLITELSYIDTLLLIQKILSANGAVFDSMTDGIRSKDDANTGKCYVVRYRAREDIGETILLSLEDHNEGNE